MKPRRPSRRSASAVHSVKTGWRVSSKPSGAVTPAGRSRPNAAPDQPSTRRRTSARQRGRGRGSHDVWDAQAAHGSASASPSIGALWGQIEPCWRSQAGTSQVSVVLVISTNAQGRLRKPPRTLRNDHERADETRLAAEARAIASLTACRPRAGDGGGHREVALTFPASRQLLRAMLRRQTSRRRSSTIPLAYRGMPEPHSPPKDMEGITSQVAPPRLRRCAGIPVRSRSRALAPKPAAAADAHRQRDCGHRESNLRTSCRTAAH